MNLLSGPVLKDSLLRAILSLDPSTALDKAPFQQCPSYLSQAGESNADVLRNSIPSSLFECISTS